ncbi:ankyrin repeat domain-containing protein [Accumulibacter sp.]|uniref:ankyrin repeat domain-containing protein n=1 Tax=Accumulibacter sp. TaxID=2053492 RepID=UPI0025FF1E61|nr:ankyrin repeat domain-containing protein [Accumulibacter sp.]MCM8596185.1 ankyrin repeat domain-containing protein [Accumulibacter sp.]MCM8625340.1 ankyrin repeat domain-containing protein [Accumulibacter sp.]MDS4050334.1 ankyrin repeat domain-containing protein [Accumulibacter sp.]
MNSAQDLLRAIRSGCLQDVQAVLDAGAPVEFHDGQGDPGLPLGVACFMGFTDIVRELVRRGASVNRPDNSQPTSPLSMAIRGKRTDVVKVLIELGADVPPEMITGLSDQELMLARWKWQSVTANVAAVAEPDVEEIEMIRCYGTDTAVLDADMIRAAREMEKK